jgi:hypothetical protein
VVIIFSALCFNVIRLPQQDMRQRPAAIFIVNRGHAGGNC